MFNLDLPSSIGKVIKTNKSDRQSCVYYAPVMGKEQNLYTLETCDVPTSMKLVKIVFEI